MGISHKSINHDIHNIYDSSVLHFVVAPDSLKGSLSAVAAADSIKLGVLRAVGGSTIAQITTIPLADGGEGTVAALVLGAGGKTQPVTVCNPLGDLVVAEWGILDDGRAVIEMAQASGLTLIPETSRRPQAASSYGTGEVIKAVLDRGYQDLLIGIGGSATSDGGAGMLQALGARLLDADGRDIPRGSEGLLRLAHIDLTNLDARLQRAKITVICDVNNPLCGANGAAYVYAPQKGATAKDVMAIDAALGNLARVTLAATGKDLQTSPGAGAAGGMGFALMSFCHAQLRRGIDVVMEVTQFAQRLTGADLVLTAEGAIDTQTLRGKTVAGVARAAGCAGVPVIAFGGKVLLTGEELHGLGVVSAFALPDAPLTLSESVLRAGELLTNVTERAVRLWLWARGSFV